jgi:DNA-binding CsgD family transcriptional regulator
MLKKIQNWFPSLPKRFQKSYDNYILILNAEKVGLISLLCIFIYFPLFYINMTDILNGDAKHWTRIGTALATVQMLSGIFISIGLWFRVKIAKIREGKLKPFGLMNSTLVGASILFTFRSVLVYLDRDSIMLYVFCLVLMHWLIYLSLSQRIFFTVLLLATMLSAMIWQNEKTVLMLEITAVGVISFFSSLQYHRQTLRQFLSRHLIEEQRDLIMKEKELQQEKGNETFFEGLTENLDAIEKSLNQNNSQHSLQELVKQFKATEKNEALVEVLLERLHPNFFKLLSERYPDLSAADHRFIALMKMNLSTKDIANLLNISNNSANTARYRLRKKLKLTSEDVLEKVVLEM